MGYLKELLSGHTVKFQFVQIWTFLGFIFLREGGRGLLLFYCQTKLSLKPYTDS